MADPTAGRGLTDYEPSVCQPSFQRPIKASPSDTVNFAKRPRFLRVGTAGMATLVYADGTAAGFPLFAGDNPVGNIVRINATGLTAGNIWLMS